MKTDAPTHEAGNHTEADTRTHFSLRVSKARHDLQNSIGHILGFTEILLEEIQEQGRERLRPDLEFISQTATQMIANIKECLDAPKIESAPGNVQALQKQICKQSSQVVAAVERLTRESNAAGDESFRNDLSRIGGAARQMIKLADTSLLLLFEPVVVGTDHLEAVSKLIPESQLIGFKTLSASQTKAEGFILLVDDLQENRELLSRRLSRLGYSVAMTETGQQALEFVSTNPVDLILLDIMMPGLNGIEVLQRLKSNPATRHTPVVMLSSVDQMDAVVHCIKLGAEDFLPKPFNATLLMARIESSLSKKTLHDQEEAFLRRLQTEREYSERLLLNILPKAIAERLKQGETIIADGFSDVTVLFSDFVGFTKKAAETAPKELVGQLNQIFSIFDQLCDRFGLEKIKTVGDEYMVAGGIPTPKPDHVEAVADLALAMHRETARLYVGNSQPFQMRIGINTGPVVAGVIGTKKFAYDLWGDTVNMAKRMETHAPVGGIRVTATTYRRLRNQYDFKPGEFIEVKGRGEVQTYVLLGKPRISV